MTPRFIVLEGLDGSGKSTQSRKLAKKLSDLKIPNFHTCQPSQGSVGKQARAVTRGKFFLEDETLALLFAADRYQHYHEEIAPRLDRGDYVICDRYYYSNIAYQGKNPAAMERVIAYNQAVMTAPIRRPDIIFFLDIPPSECMCRITSRRSKVSIYETLTRLEQMRERYFAAFERLKAIDNVVIIDAVGKSSNQVFAKIWSCLKIDE
ncbi:MAG: dTMP kinase [Defluviitaleaceae bacterium]|nr:dTMP kinase [Defluviitaleaceae bacterium]